MTVDPQNRANLIAALRKKASFFRRMNGDGHNETELLLIRAAEALTPSERDPDWYDTHCPTCDAPEPTHAPTCAVPSPTPTSDTTKDGEPQ